MSYQFYFETLRVWKDSMELVKGVYDCSTNFPKQEQFGLTSQIRRAAVSVASNLAEGSVRKSFKEQARFTEIAFGSLMEVHCQLTIAQQLNYLQEETKIKLQDAIGVIARQLNALRDTQESRVGEPEVAYETLESRASSHLPIFPSSYFKHESAIIDSGAAIGANTKIWHFSHIMSGAVVGKNCNIGQNVFIANGVIVGNNVKVQNNVSIYEGVTCEDDVFLGPSMVFTNVINPRSAVNRKNEYLKTHVGKGATIGANATIVCGNNIGNYAFVGAGSVVTKDIPNYAMVVGNPAKNIGWMSECGEKLEFNNDGEATCKESGVYYRFHNNQVEQITASSHLPILPSSA